jgi:hypothetical protein
LEMTEEDGSTSIYTADTVLGRLGQTEPLLLTRS